MQTQINLNPRQHLKNLVHGYNLSCAIYQCVRLGIPDIINTQPATCSDIIKITGSHYDALERVMDLLVSVDIFSKNSSNQYTHTELSKFLTTIHPNSIAKEVLLFGGEEAYLAWSKLNHSIKTGETGFKAFYGCSLFSYLADAPESAKRFHDGWREISMQTGKELADTLSFDQITTLIDVGGGYGAVIANILKKHQHLQGIIYDLEFSMDGAKETLQEHNVENRCKLTPGNALESVPKINAEMMLLKSVLHVFDDKDCISVLKNCAQSLHRSGRIVVIERVIHQDEPRDWSRVVNATMLVMTGGRERTLNHYAQIFEKANLVLMEEIRLPSGFSAVIGQLATK